MKTKRSFSRNARNLNRKPDAPIAVTIFFMSCFFAMTGIIALQFYKHTHPEAPFERTANAPVVRNFITFLF